MASPNNAFIILYRAFTSTETHLMGYRQYAWQWTVYTMAELERFFYHNGLTVDNRWARENDLLVRSAGGQLECVHIGGERFHPVTIRTDDRDTVLCEWEALEAEGKQP